MSQQKTYAYAIYNHHGINPNRPTGEVIVFTNPETRDQWTSIAFEEENDTFRAPIDSTLARVLMKQALSTTGAQDYLKSAPPLDQMDEPTLVSYYIGWQNLEGSEYSNQKQGVDFELRVWEARQKTSSRPTMPPQPMHALTGRQTILQAVRNYPAVIVPRKNDPEELRDYLDAPKIQVRVHDPNTGDDYGNFTILPPVNDDNDDDTPRYEIMQTGFSLSDMGVLPAIKSILAEKALPILRNGQPIVIVEQWADGRIVVKQGTVRITSFTYSDAGYIE